MDLVVVVVVVDRSEVAGQNFRATRRGARAASPTRSEKTPSKADMKDKIHKYIRKYSNNILVSNAEQTEVLAIITNNRQLVQIDTR